MQTRENPQQFVCKVINAHSLRLLLIKIEQRKRKRDKRVKKKNM